MISNDGALFGESNRVLLRDRIGVQIYTFYKLQGSGEFKVALTTRAIATWRFPEARCGVHLQVWPARLVLGCSSYSTRPVDQASPG